MQVKNWKLFESGQITFEKVYTRRSNNMFYSLFVFSFVSFILIYVSLSIALVAPSNKIISVFVLGHNLLLIVLLSF